MVNYASTLRPVYDGSAESWPTPDAGAPIYPGHWHRYRIGYSKDDTFFLQVIPWSMFRGRYVNTEWNNAGHTDTSAPNDVPSPGDIVFGGPQTGTGDGHDRQDARRVRQHRRAQLGHGPLKLDHLMG